MTNPEMNRPIVYRVQTHKRASCDYREVIHPRATSELETSFVGSVISYFFKFIWRRGNDPALLLLRIPLS